MAKGRVVHAWMAATILGLMLCTQVSFADSYARIVRLSDIEGSVEIDRNTGQGFENAILNSPITQGMRIQTGISGRAEIEFENGTAVRLAGDTEVDISQLFLRSDGGKDSEISVGSGAVYVDYKHSKNDDFRVTFANRAVDLERDVHFRVSLTNDNLQLAVFKGELQVTGDDSETATIKKSETFNLDLTDGARYELAKGIDQFPEDTWDEQREAYLAQSENVQTYTDSPYSYGASDLSAYGTFFQVPGYGWMWQPSDIGPGWDPYGNGAWGYYPGYGYTFISYYPWGWMPYRYGSWVHVPNYGWAWQPGNWNHWHSGPVIVNPPAAYRPPVVPRTGTSTIIVGHPPTVHPPSSIQMTGSGRGRPNRGVMDDAHVAPERRGNVPANAATTPAPGTAPTAGANTPAPGVVQPGPNVHFNHQGPANAGEERRNPNIPDSLRQPRGPQPGAAPNVQRPAGTTPPTAAEPGRNVHFDHTGPQNAPRPANTAPTPAPAMKPAPAPAPAPARPAPAPAAPPAIHFAPAPAPHSNPSPRTMSAPSPHSMGMAAGGGARASSSHR